MFTLIVRSDVVSWLTENKFTGWYTKQIEIQGSPNVSKLPEMHQLFVTGRGGPALTEPETYQTFHCNICGRIEYSRSYLDALSLNEEAWDGSHIFRFDRPYIGHIFVTEPFADALICSGFQTSHCTARHRWWSGEINTVNCAQ